MLHVKLLHNHYLHLDWYGPNEYCDLLSSNIKKALNDLREIIGEVMNKDKPDFFFCEICRIK